MDGLTLWLEFRVGGLPSPQTPRLDLGGVTAPSSPVLAMLPPILREGSRAQTHSAAGAAAFQTPRLDLGVAPAPRPPDPQC